MPIDDTLRERRAVRRIEAWGRNANIATMVVLAIGVVLGFASRGSAEIGPFSLIAYALVIPVCGVHIYVACVASKRRGEHVLMAVGTFFLTFLAVAVGRGQF